jgi:hypothetical protein
MSVWQYRNFVPAVPGRKTGDALSARGYDGINRHICQLEMSEKIKNDNCYGVSAFP